MKPYTEDLRIVLYFASALGASLLAGLNKWIEDTFATIGTRSVARILIFVSSLASVYFIDLAFICLCSPYEFQASLVKRWKNFLEHGLDPQLWERADDLVNRAASFVVWWQWWRLLR